MSEWVLEVSEVNEYVRQLLQNEPALRKVRLRGEISNFKRHSISPGCAVICVSLREKLCGKLPTCSKPP